MEKIKLLISIFIFLLLLSATLGFGAYFLIGEYFKYVFGVSLILSVFFMLYLFFFESKDV